MRRELLRTAAAGLLLGALLGTGSGACTEPPPRPNIVVIVWDTTRVDRLSAFGYGRPTTPFLEGFAAGAVKYTNAFSPAPWTPPAHASLFTGLYPHRHGLEHGRGDRMHHGIPTLAKTLSGAGYRTVCFTANAHISATTGLQAGFGEFFPVFNAPAREGSPGKPNDAEAVRVAVAEWAAGHRKSEGAPVGSGRPTFLFLNLMDAHQPHSPSQADLLAVRDPEVTQEDLAKAASRQQRDFLAHIMGTAKFDEGTLRALRMRYDASIRFMDRKTGEILDLLGKEGLLEDAVVVLAADHGEGLGEHGLVEHRLSAYDHLLHIPLVVRWPGKFDGGKVVERAVCLLDAYPTLLDAAGVPVPAGTGTDAVPLPREPGIAGGRQLLAEFSRPLSHIEEMKKDFPTAPPSIFHLLSVSIEAIREPADAKRTLKYLRYERWNPDGTTAGLDREELFDWVADPDEERNLLPSGDPKERAEADRMEKRLREIKSGRKP